MSLHMRGKKVIEAHIVLSTVVMMMDKSLWGLKEGWENIPGTTLRVRKIQTFFNFHDLMVFILFNQLLYSIYK